MPGHDDDQGGMTGGDGGVASEDQMQGDMSGGGQAKIDALEAVGVRVGRTPTEVAQIAVEILGG